ncbi:helix-turn-helix domain-containing protein [Frigidibacter sp.]|uniref:helix-turn-helix domain-containing protein n=1 Tax=Frigidibacter sp. TaxID=2586418 RepID=UPI002734057A|nr:cupin domain-containing protein [Frigidibacter sp.]MDP3342484.1 cupin domain-containing protein [Frigidibacter sp.]
MDQRAETPAERPPEGQAPEPHVGFTLRRLRKQSGMSLQALAAASGVSVGMISQVERGLANPSVRLLTALRRALNVSMQDLFGDAPAAGTPDSDPPFVRRRENRPVINLGSIRKELMTPPDRQNLQLMILRIEPGGESGGRALSYPAEKGGFVMSGRLTLTVNDQRVELNTGDSFCFDSALPHSLCNTGDEPVEVLWIIGAVQFDRHL